MQSRFEKVIVIGYGKTAGDVLSYVAEKQKFFKYQTVCIEHEFHGMSKLRSVCEKMGAEYVQIIDRKKLTQVLLSIKEATLIVSAGNNYLFPDTVVEKDNLEIINFHSALLPRYPGRNAQSWAIYNGETVSGATWHYVTQDVDSGAIIAQRRTPLTEDIKAYELTRDIMEAASKAFISFFEELLIHHIEGRPQPEQARERKIYYSWELPGGGLCSINDPPEKVYRILRAMDYGKSDIFPEVRIRLADGREVEVIRYRKAEKKHLNKGQRVLLDENDKQIYLAMNGEYELAIKFKQ